MDGSYHMTISQPLRYDAKNPTVLQVGSGNFTWCCKLYLQTFLQLLACHLVQVHAWVTEQSLKPKRLEPWRTLAQHPVAATSVTVPKQQRRNRRATSNLGMMPAISKSAQSKPVRQTAAGSSTPKKHSATVAVTANSSLVVPGVSSPDKACMCPEAAAQQAASLFSVESVQAVLAVGTSGPVLNARYKHNACTFTILACTPLFAAGPVVQQYSL